MNNMLLSIIIPVYNIEEYLSNCLDSILPICSDDCEIILAIGDSSDASNDICNKYHKTYPIIKVVKQSGKGLSNARNCALDISQGEYISYIDGDDYVDSIRFAELLKTLRGVQGARDLIVTDFQRVVSSNGKIEKIYQIGEGTEENYEMSFLNTMLRKKECFWNVWRYVYRRSFLEANKIRFLEDKLSEDINYTTRVLLACPRIMFVHCPFYFYRIGRGNSLMDRPTYKRLCDTVDILCNSIRLAENSAFEYGQILIAQYQFEYILNMAIVCEIARVDKKRASILYKETLDILLVGTDSFSKFTYNVLKVVPFPVVAEILHLLKCCKRFITRSPRKITTGG